MVMGVGGWRWYLGSKVDWWMVISDC